MKYSISEFENGQRFVNVDVDQEIFVGLSPEKALEARAILSVKDSWEE